MAVSYADRPYLTALATISQALSSIPIGDQDKALSAASRFADSYLSARYAVPLVSWDDDIRDAVCSIAAYRLLRRRGFNPANPGDVAAKEAADGAVAWFKDIANDRATPANVVDSTPGDEGQGAVTMADDNVPDWLPNGGIF